MRCDRSWGCAVARMPVNRLHTVHTQTHTHTHSQEIKAESPMKTPSPKKASKPKVRVSCSRMRLFYMCASGVGECVPPYRTNLSLHPKPPIPTEEEGHLHGAQGHQAQGTSFAYTYMHE